MYTWVSRNSGAEIIIFLSEIVKIHLAKFFFYLFRGLWMVSIMLYVSEVMSIVSPNISSKKILQT